MKFGAHNTVAMIYDDFPIIDYFQYVSDDLMAGSLSSKMYGTEGPFFFTMKRLS